MIENKIAGRQIIEMDPVLLSQAGRVIPLPFHLTFKESVTQQNTVLNCVQILRLLPQRRLVCRAICNEKSVIVKIFFHPEKAHSDYNNELQGYERIKKTGILTPEQLGFGGIVSERPVHNGYCVLYDYIEHNCLLEKLISVKPDIQSINYIEQIMGLVAKMHSTGVQQIDLHLNNFLTDKKTSEIYTLDCADVVDLHSSNGRLCNEVHKNLADILSQLPIIYDQLTDRFLGVYEQYLKLDIRIAKKQIVQEMSDWRRWRIRKYLKKLTRNCSEFNYKKTWSLLTVMRRHYSSGAWLSFYKKLDELVEQSQRLKNGNTATVALTECAGQKVVIKRYNIKNLRHLMSRFWRPSRAWKTWQNAHRLHVLGIKTPEPVAVIEKRFGWFRSKAFYLSLYEPASDATIILHNGNVLSKTMLEDFELLFNAMIMAKISHGDLKANNILLTDGGLTLIDLDAMRFHSHFQSFKKAFKRDLRRFMRNWTDTPHIYEQFEQLIKKLPV